MKRVFVAGHRGLVGSALVRRLSREPGVELLTLTRERLDLTEQAAVRDFFERERPDQVYLAAAKVGGIHANATYPAEFIQDNLDIQNHVIQGASRSGVERLLFLGSSCIYPRLSPQPIPESALLTGPLEPTNQPYALAKIAGLELCRSYNRQYGTDFRCVMPTNLFGPHDNFDLDTSHVLPALMHRFHQATRQNAPTVTVWGSGAPRREFLHSDDLADACVHVMNLPEDPGLLNIGTGQDLTIAELAEMMCEVVGYQGDLRFDRSRPDGPPQKLLDVSRISATGWRPRRSLREGIEQTYQWFRDTELAGRS